MNQKEHYEKMNKDIRDAILVSQMMDTEGFKIFKNYLDSESKAIRFQDILGIRDNNAMLNQQGVALAFEDIKQFFINMEILAKKPMVDPDTGEEEILNKKYAK